MKNFIPALRMMIFMTLLTGIAYPLVVTGIGRVLFPRQANGSLIERAGMTVGSDLLAQKFEGPKYFWPRPSGVDYNPLPSGGTNLGQASGHLKKSFEERVAKFKAAHPEMGTELPPQDLLFASSSGLDPHISPAAAQYQMKRVAMARGMELAAVRKIVKSMTEGRQFGIFGEPRINVFALNRALDDAQKK